MHFVHYGNQPYCIIISDNQPYCIICNCSFSHYGLHIVSLIYFQHISFFQSGQAEQSWVEPSTFSSPLCLFFSQVSLVGFLFLLGLYISSLASCMGGLYGAPRILQCIAQERVIPALGFLGKGVGACREIFKTGKARLCDFMLNKIKWLIL